MHDKCWPLNLEQFEASSIFIPDHWGLKHSINGRRAVQCSESVCKYKTFFHFPQSYGHNTNVDVSLFCPLLFEQRTPETACAGRLTLCFFMSLSYCFSPLAVETPQIGQKRTQSAAILKMSSWPVVQTQMQRDVHRLACLPVCRHCGCHLLSLVYTNHVIPLWPAGLKIGLAKRGSTGLMWFLRWTSFSDTLISLVSLHCCILSVWADQKLYF